MRYSEIKRMIVIIALAGTLSACGVEAGQEEPSTVTESSTEATILEESSSATASTIKEIARYTLSFNQSGNDNIGVEEGEDVEVPEYLGIKLLDNIDFSNISLNEDGYYCIDNEPICSEEYAVVDEENKEIILRNVRIPYEVK